MGVTRYLADKSALARIHLPAVREELEPLIARALVGICGVTELEMLFSARNIQERSRMKEQLAASLDHIDTPEDIWDQAAKIQEALTEQAQHRSASIPDLLVAATARARGLEILHYDRDFDTIARYTEQASRWVVPPGTVLSPPGSTRQRCDAQLRNVHAQAVEMQPALPVPFIVLIAELLVAPELVVGLGKLAEFKRTPGPCGRPLEPIDIAPEEEAEQPGLRLGDRFSSCCHPDLLEAVRTYILTIRRWSDKTSDCGAERSRPHQARPPVNWCAAAAVLAAPQFLPQLARVARTQGDGRRFLVVGRADQHQQRRLGQLLRDHRGHAVRPRGPGHGADPRLPAPGHAVGLDGVPNRGHRRHLQVHVVRVYGCWRMRSLMWSSNRPGR